jgi:DNA repair photolyase
MNIKTVDVKSVLVKSVLPDADYVINPYIGCQFACMYCYASFMGRFVDETVRNWGDYLYVKSHAIEIFHKEYLALKKRHQTPSILLSSVTDPYQGAEKQYKLTRRILEILANDAYPGKVSVLTKSPMVLRDIDLFVRLPNIEVGLTVTSADDRISRFLEIRAPAVTKRFEALRALRIAGISTYAFIGPLLPHFRYLPEELERLIVNIHATQVQSVYVEHINLKPYILRRLDIFLKGYSIEVQKLYQKAKFVEHHLAISTMVQSLLAKYGLHLRLNKVLSHKNSIK